MADSKKIDPSVTVWAGKEGVTARPFPALADAIAVECAFRIQDRLSDRRDFANYCRGFRDMYGHLPL